MKRLILLYFLVSFIGFSFSENIFDYAKKHLEYVYYDDSKGLRYTYTTSYGRNIYILSTMQFTVLKNQQQFKYFFKTHSYDDYIAFLDKNKIFLLHKNKSKFDVKANCKTINSTQQKIFDSYIFSDSQNHILKINNYDGIIFGDDISGCYYKNKTFYYPIDGISKKDFEYFYYTYNDLIKYIDFSESNDKLSNIYNFIIKNTSYDYDTLSKLASKGKISDPTAFSVSSFFEGKKLVCQGYSKTLSFMANYNGIKTENIIGNIQPIDESKLNGGQLSHSWVKYNDLYYDPTFDDSGNDGEETNYYFGKPKVCFNLNHYITGWVKFETKEQRRDYIKSNIKELSKYCHLTMKNYILNDGNIVDFIKLSLEQNDLEFNKKMVCDYFDACDKNFYSKDEILNYLKGLILYVIVDGQKTSYDLSDLLSGYTIKQEIKTNKTDYNVSNQETKVNKPNYNYWQKIIISKVDNFLAKIYALPDAKRQRKLLLIKTKIEKIISKGNLNEKQTFLLNYLYKRLFLDKS